MFSKKLISIFLALCIVLSLLPIGTLAADNATPVIENGIYIIADENSSGTMIAGHCPNEGRSYGYLYDDYSAAEQHKTTQYTFSHAGNGKYTIVDHYGRYLGVSGTYKSFQLYTSNVGDACLWTITASAGGKYAIQSVSNGAFIDYSIDYGSFGVYPSTDIPVDGKISLIPLGSSQPEEPSTPIIPGTDTYLIYVPAYGKALSSQKSGYYNAGIDVSVSGNTVSGYGATELWNISFNSDGTITISQNGQNLGMADSFTSMNLGEAHDRWIMEDAGNGLYYIKNSIRGNYMQWYAQYGNWSSYPLIPAGNEGAYALALILVNAGSPGQNTHGFTNGFCSHCNQFEPASLKENVYEISNAGQLYWFANQVNIGNSSINGKLMADITVNSNILTPSRRWTPIGSETYPYDGTFDGNGKTISGLYYNDTITDYVGLFGYASKNSVIKNTGVIDSYLCCASKSEGTNSGYDFAGGLVGYNNGTVKNCYYSGTVIVDNPDDRAYNLCAGGIVGCNIGTISGCYSSGSVSGSHKQSSIGGVAGTNWNIITNCYNTSFVNGSHRAGGIAGSIYSGTVSNCHNTGSIHANFPGLDVGGIIGLYDSGSVSNCYYLADCIQNSNMRGTSKSADAFYSGEVCYLLQGQQNEQIWGQKIGNDDYPVFSTDLVYSSNGNYSNQPPASGITISGSITSYLIIGKVTVELIQNGKIISSAVISGNTYSFEGIAKGTYTIRFSKENHISQSCEITVTKDTVAPDMTIFPMGDVTGDGVVNIKDFQRLLRHVNKTNPLTGYELACGDITGDGVVNIKDFQRLLRHVNKTNPLF